MFSALARWFSVTACTPTISKMSEFTPVPANIAPGPAPDGTVVAEALEEAPEPQAISEQEVGEYREQDRFLPVRTQNISLAEQPLRMCLDCECREDHERICASNSKDREGCEGVCAGVRVRVHQLHHIRSRREMPDGEAQNDWRRRYSLRHDQPRL